MDASGLSRAVAAGQHVGGINRQVKLTKPSVKSYGGLTTCTQYNLIAKSEHVVDSVFMHDNYAASPAAGESAMVVVTDNNVWTVAEDEDD